MGKHTIRSSSKMLIEPVKELGREQVKAKTWKLDCGRRREGWYVRASGRSTADLLLWMRPTWNGHPPINDFFSLQTQWVASHVATERSMKPFFASRDIAIAA